MAYTKDDQIESLKSTMNNQSKNLALALKEKNDALMRVAKLEAIIEQVGPKPKFQIGQVVIALNRDGSDFSPSRIQDVMWDKMHSEWCYKTSTSMGGTTLERFYRAIRPEEIR